jgi:hypothetical protein
MSKEESSRKIVTKYLPQPSEFNAIALYFAVFSMITVFSNNDLGHFELLNFTSCKIQTLSPHVVVHRRKLWTTSEAINIYMSVGAKPGFFQGVFNLSFFQEPGGKVKRAMRS